MRRKTVTLSFSTHFGNCTVLHLNWSFGVMNHDVGNIRQVAAISGRGCDEGGERRSKGRAAAPMPSI